MKKILLATSALVASASIAAADVSISGFAEMGIVDNGNGDAQLHQDIDVTFKLSGETDGGLSFGAAIDIDEADAGIGDSPFTGPTHGGVAVYVSGAFGTLTMGDTDGASDWATQETNIVDALQDEFEHAGWDGNSAEGGDGQVLRYDYSFGAFGVAVSAVQGDNGVGVVDDIFAVGAKYSADMGGATVGFGVGYQDRGAEDKTSASVKVDVDAITGVLYYSDDSVDGSNVGVAASYTTGALTVGASWGDFSDLDESGYAVAVNYDLGGGAVVQVGYANSDVAGTETDKWSAGLAMSF